MRTINNLFFEKWFFFIIFISICLSVKAEVKVDFDNLPYVEDYWMLPAKEIDERANAGDPFAQRVLSRFYYEGSNNYPYNEKLSKEWTEKAFSGFEKLAAQGDASTQAAIGFAYLDNKIIDVDVNKAINYLTSPAMQGNVNAQYLLGEIYENGIFGVFDPELSKYWYEKALPAIKQGANKGDFLSIQRLYNMSHSKVRGDIDQVNYWHDKWIETLKKKVKNIHKHSFNSSLMFSLASAYSCRIEPKGRDDTLIAKVYALTALVDKNTKSDWIKKQGKNLREIILSRAGISSMSTTEFEVFAQQCMKNWTEDCY